VEADLNKNQTKSNNSIRGGARTGAGRKKGSINKATADIREAAQQYTEQALTVLVEIAMNGESEAARVAAANSILDRAHGKPRQAVDANLSGEVGLSVVIKQFTAPAPDGD